MNPIIELCRGIAAFMVMTCHYYPRFIDPERSFFNFLWTGVDLFFLMSGFVFGYHVFNRTIDGYPFYIRRFFRIYPLYFLSLILYFLYTPKHSEKLVYLFKHLFFLNTTTSMTETFFFNPAYWSLPVEIEFYLFLPILGMIAGKRGRFWIFIASLVILKLLISIPPSNPVAPSIWNILNVHLPGILLEFAAGLLLYKASECGRNISTPFNILVFVLGMVMLSLLAGSFIRMGEQGIQNSLFFRAFFPIGCTIGYGMVIFPFLQLKPGEKFLKICLLMGSISYGVYLFHNLIPKMLFHYNIQMTGISAFMVSAAATVLLSFLIYHMYENPMRNYGRKISMQHGNIEKMAISPAKTAYP